MAELNGPRRNASNGSERNTLMAKKTETIQIKPAAVLRNGWLAYLGLYGAAFERVKPLTSKYADALEGLIAKGEDVEANAQDVVEDVRERATDFYGEGVNRVRRFLPGAISDTGRIEELEAEIDALNKKVAAMTKKPAAKRTTKSRAKAA